MDSGTLQLNHPSTRRERTVSSCHRYMLWIDGVGAWQLCVGDRFVIGAPSFERQPADIALIANVSRQHATIIRRRNEWSLEAHHPTTVTGHPVLQPVLLRSGDQICPAERVKLGFRIPSVLSSSAVIDFESDHRPSHSVDGIILMADHCLLGPRRDHHVWCRHWPDQVVLFCEDGQLRCRSKSQLAVNGRDVSESGNLQHGSVVTSEAIRFRVEEMS